MRASEATRRWLRLATDILEPFGAVYSDQIAEGVAAALRARLYLDPTTRSTTVSRFLGVDRIPTGRRNPSTGSPAESPSSSRP